MFPLHFDGIARVMMWELGELRGLSIRHALIHNHPGLLGDHPRQPRSVLLIRHNSAPDGMHVFGAGSAKPALAWLAQRGQNFSLVAPESWEGAIRRRSSLIQRGFVETWIRSPDIPLTTARSRGASIASRFLLKADSEAFAAAAPHWALCGWGDFTKFLKQGAAIGVPDRSGGFASLAWIFESDMGNDSVAVATNPRYQRLGLGYTAAATLVRHVEIDRKKRPIWTVNDTNIPSKALARSLGFSTRSRESVLRWNA